MLRNYLDIFCIAYLNDILIYSYCKANNVAHVSKVLEAVLQYRLFGRLNKCKFLMKKVGFLRFIVLPGGVAMKSGKMSCVAD